MTTDSPDLASNRVESLTTDFVGPASNAPVVCEETRPLAELLWHMLASERDMYNLVWVPDSALPSEEIRFAPPLDLTDLGKKVGRDEIHWWVFSREQNLDELIADTRLALEAAQVLKKASDRFKDAEIDSYAALLTQLKGFVVANTDSIRAVRNYASSLRRRDPLAPSMLFTYKVWGASRKTDRRVSVHADQFEAEASEVVHALTEVALGLMQAHPPLYEFQRAAWDVGEMAFDAGHEGDFTPDMIAATHRMTARRCRDEFAIFFEFIRASLRQIEIEIETCSAQRSRLGSEGFWRSFILAALPPAQMERQHWDFKEMLPLWTATGAHRNAAQIRFAEDVASFGNAEGGALVLGVSDDRRVVGIGIGHEAETRVKMAADVLSQRLIYPRQLFSFHLVSFTDPVATCLVVAVARAIEAVVVKGENGNFTCPVRAVTGLSRDISPRDLSVARMHDKSESWEFLKLIEEFAHER